MVDEEMLDRFDAHGRHIGTAPRRSVHGSGEWHRTLHLWLATETGGGGLLYQLRAATTETWPGLLDVSVAGHLLAGETYLDGLREAREEIGVAVPREDVISLGIRRETGPHPGGGINREFQGVHIVRLDPRWGSFEANDREAAGLFRVTNADGLKLHRDDVEEIECDALIFADNGVVRNERRRVTAASFVPRPAYYARMHDIADALLVGRDLPDLADKSPDSPAGV